ncbi:hypothetical protein FQZ97_548480 [compost metagenome]
MPPSFPRRRESSVFEVPRRGTASHWVPAYAGTTTAGYWQASRHVQACCGLSPASGRGGANNCDNAKRAQRRVPGQGPRPEILPARSAAVGVPATPPAAGVTPSSGLVQASRQSRATVAHHGVRQSCSATKPSPVRKPRHATIRVAARRAVNALFGDFLSLGQKVTRPSGRNRAHQIPPDACRRHNQPPPSNHPQTTLISNRLDHKSIVKSGS